MHTFRPGKQTYANVYVVFKGSRRVGERDRSFLSASLRSRPSRNVAHRMTGYRLRTRYTGHGATRGCIAHMQYPCTRTIIPGSPAAAALSTCCPQADRPTDTGLAPVRPFSDARGRTSFSCSTRSFFEMGTLGMSGDVLAIALQIMTEQQESILAFYLFLLWILLFFSCRREYGNRFFCLIFWRWKLCFDIFANYPYIFSYYLLCLLLTF